MSESHADQVSPDTRLPTSPLGWVKRLALVVVLAAAVYAVKRNYASLGDDLERLPWWLVLLAFVPGTIGMLLALQVWRQLMAGLGAPLPLRASARVFFLSQLGKYVPGSIWSVVGQMELGKEYDVPRRTSAAVGVLVLVLSGASGISVAVLLLPLLGGDVVRSYWWVALVLPFLYACLHPPILGRIVNAVLRVARREPLATLPSWSRLARALLLQAVVWILFGTQAWLLLVGLGASPGESFPVAVGGYALAYSLGMLAVVLPAGAGVREAALVVALSSVVAPSAALLVALLCRMLLTLTDVLTAGVVLMRHKSRAG